MNTLHRLLALPVLALTVATTHAGTFADINLVDGGFSDWSGVVASATNTGTGPIQQIFIANNDTHLFVRITFNTNINIVSDGFRMNIDSDNNTGTGFNTFFATLGATIGSELLYEGEFAYQQASGNYNTGATTNAPLLIGAYNESVTSVEFGIVRTAVSNTANSTLVFPNDTFKLAVYFGDDATSFNAAEYTFATSQIPEPATFAGLAGMGALTLAFFRRRR
ncbi:MAG: PEP-CTERM sorting domain-containing protein [Opitutaceae bacterium]|jgi:hypothetical protein